MYNETVKNILFCYILCTCVQARGHKIGTSQAVTQDQTSPRANTLFDDPDDIQNQLDNEARDRLLYGKPKTIWVLHFPHASAQIGTTRSVRKIARQSLPTECPDCQDCTENTFQYDEVDTTLPDDETWNSWDYKGQNQWSSTYPDCGGHFQSPVDIPFDGLIKTRGARKLFFCNYDTKPNSYVVMNDGVRVSLFGQWPESKRPMIFGGAAYGRRYLFHSLALHWPSEHTIGGLHYPLESQAIHVSAEYPTLDEAVKASSRDKLALLAVANLYKYSNHSHDGLEDLINSVISTAFMNGSLTSRPLTHFVPSLKEYACYHGSLTTPPCTEAMLWFVRARALPVTRRLIAKLESNMIVGEPGQFLFRQTQPLNDRRVFFFN